MQRVTIFQEPKQLGFFETNLIRMEFVANCACDVSPPLTNCERIINDWMVSEKIITAHQLAKLLLDGPDVPVMVNGDSNVCETEELTVEIFNLENAADEDSPGGEQILKCGLGWEDRGLLENEGAAVNDRVRCGNVVIKQSPIDK
ncbi:MAG: hypothetical protein V3T17_19250 [Pseudomonadales bacterium]